MKAAVVESPGRLVVKDTPEPPIGDYDALCEILYGATCTGTDPHIIRGSFPFPVRYPTILGHESIGRVVRTGAGVRNLKPGDLVTRVGTLPFDGYDVNWGGFAEFGVARDYRAAREYGVPAPEWDGFRVNQVLPSDFDPAAATMIITWRETLSYITRMGFCRGKTLLIVGSGGNGLAFAAHARNMGASRVAMIGSALRKPAAELVGVDDFFDYREAGSVEAARDCAPEGFDFVVDAIGKKETLNPVMGCVAFGGIVGIYGVDDWGKWVISPGAARGTFTYSNAGYDEEESHERVIGFIREGRLKPEPWLDVSQAFPLSDIAQAFESVRERRMVKALVRVRGT